MTYILLLRGINVSGQKLIKMEYLREQFAAWGYTNVRTYIQSGNVIFDSTEKKEQVLYKKISAQLHKALGYGVEIFLRNVSEIAEVVKQNPFTDSHPDDKMALYVSFLAEVPTEENRKKLEGLSDELNRYIIINREVYCFISKHERNAKTIYSNNWLEKKLGMPATARNWNTVNKLLHMSQGEK